MSDNLSWLHQSVQTPAFREMIEWSGAWKVDSERQISSRNFVFVDDKTSSGTVVKTTTGISIVCHFSVLGTITLHSDGSRYFQKDCMKHDFKWAMPDVNHRLDMLSPSQICSARKTDVWITLKN